MNFYEDEKFEEVMEQITETMGYLILDIIKMGLKKINAETKIFEDILESKLEVKTEDSSKF